MTSDPWVQLATWCPSAEPFNQAIQCAPSMGDAAHNRIWRFSLLAWVALVAIPTVVVSVAWMLGITTDSSVPNVFDLAILFIFMLPVPAAIVVFALLVPLAIATDRTLRGRTPRLLNITLGGALGVAAFTLFFAASALLQIPTPFTPRRMIAGGVSLNTLYGILAPPQTTPLLTPLAVVVSGMLVGLGLRHRAAPVRPA